jgi:hypothetical protein
MTEKEPQEYEALCIGGDFAGLQAKFDTAGAHIPVPEHWIPEELLQWGQEPSSLEVLVSEVWNIQGSSTTNILLDRQTITILPAIGCAIDHLETMKKEETIAKDQAQWAQPSYSVFCFDTSTTMSSMAESKKTLRLETFFSLRDSHRIRIGLNLMIRRGADDSFSYELQSPVEVYLSDKLIPLALVELEQIKPWMGELCRLCWAAGYGILFLPSPNKTKKVRENSGNQTTTRFICLETSQSHLERRQVKSINGY